MTLRASTFYATCLKHVDFDVTVSSDIAFDVDAVVIDVEGVDVEVETILKDEVKVDVTVFDFDVVDVDVEDVEVNQLLRGEELSFPD